MIVVYHTCAYQLSAPNASANIIAYAWLGCRCSCYFRLLHQRNVRCHQAQAVSVEDLPLARYRRIFPPFWIVLFIGAGGVGLAGLVGRTALFADAIPSPALLSASQWFGNLTLTESFRYLIGGAP